MDALAKRAAAYSNWHDAAWQQAPAAYSTVLQWYQQQSGGGSGAFDHVDCYVYDKLFFADEEFGSAITSGGQSTWIRANFDGAGQQKLTDYGCVSYLVYVRH